MNNKIFKLLTKELTNKLQNKEYIKLESNLKEINLLVLKLKNLESECINELNIHCTEQRRLIQLQTEIKKQNSDEQIVDQINQFNLDLIEIIDKYELEYIEDFSNRIIEIIKPTFIEIIQETNSFLNKKQEYLIQYKTDNNQIKIFNQESEDLKSRLNKDVKKLKNLIFNNNKIEFIESIDEYLLGYIEYDKCFKVIFVFNSLKSHFIIIIIFFIYFRIY
jgi:hypothetical protein